MFQDRSPQPVRAISSRRGGESVPTSRDFTPEPPTASSSQEPRNLNGTTSLGPVTGSSRAQEPERRNRQEPQRSQIDQDIETYRDYISRAKSLGYTVVVSPAPITLEQSELGGNYIPVVASKKLRDTGLPEFAGMTNSPLHGFLAGNAFTAYEPPEISGRGLSYINPYQLRILDTPEGKVASVINYLERDPAKREIYRRPVPDPPSAKDVEELVLDISKKVAEHRPRLLEQLGEIERKPPSPYLSNAPATLEVSAAQRADARALNTEYKETVTFVVTAPRATDPEYSIYLNRVSDSTKTLQVEGSVRTITMQREIRPEDASRIGERTRSVDRFGNEIVRSFFLDDNKEGRELVVVNVKPILSQDSTSRSVPLQVDLSAAGITKGGLNGVLAVRTIPRRGEIDGVPIHAPDGVEVDMEKLKPFVAGYKETRAKFGGSAARDIQGIIVTEDSAAGGEAFRSTISVSAKILTLSPSAVKEVGVHEAIHNEDEMSLRAHSSDPRLASFHARMLASNPAFFDAIDERQFDPTIGRGGHSRANVQELLASSTRAALSANAESLYVDRLNSFPAENRRTFAENYTENLKNIIQIYREDRSIDGESKVVQQLELHLQRVERANSRLFPSN